MKAMIGTKKGGKLAQRPFSPIVESALPVYAAGVGLGIGCGAMALLLLLGLLSV